MLTLANTLWHNIKFCFLLLASCSIAGLPIAPAPDQIFRMVEIQPSCRVHSVSADCTSVALCQEGCSMTATLVVQFVRPNATVVHSQGCCGVMSVDQVDPPHLI
jgi:hypothetical protein